MEVDAAAIQSGQANTSEEKFRPTWMDIGGTANGSGTPPSGPPAEGQTSSEPASSNDNGGAGEGREGAGMEGEIYLARVNWLQDGSLCAQVQNRAQTELRLLRLDPRSGAPTTLVVEKSKVWVNLHHLLRSLPAPALQVCPCFCFCCCRGRWRWCCCCFVVVVSSSSLLFLLAYARLVLEFWRGCESVDEQRVS